MTSMIGLLVRHAGASCLAFFHQTWQQGVSNLTESGAPCFTDITRTRAIVFIVAESCIKRSWTVEVVLHVSSLPESRNFISCLGVCMYVAEAFMRFTGQLFPCPCCESVTCQVQNFRWPLRAICFAESCVKMGWTLGIEFQGHHVKLAEVVLVAQLVSRRSWRRRQIAGGGSNPRWSTSKFQVHNTVLQSINGRPNQKNHVKLAGKSEFDPEGRSCRMLQMMAQRNISKESNPEDLTESDMSWVVTPISHFFSGTCSLSFAFLSVSLCLQWVCC